MIGLSVENRKLAGARALSEDLVRHIQGRYHAGKIAIVTDQPVALKDAVSKQWQKLTLQAARERSGASGSRKSELDQELASLQRVTFTAKPPIYDPSATICFATVGQFLQAPPVCNTVYLTCVTERVEQYMLTSWMSPHGLVVVYDQQ